MKKPKSNSRLKIVESTIAIVLIGVFILKINPSKNRATLSPNNDPSINYAPATTEEKNDAQQQKINADQNTNNTGPKESKLSIINALYDESTASVVVKTALYGKGWTSCTLVLSNNQNTVTKKSETLYQPEYYTCLGFAVPRSELGPGTWKIILTSENSDSNKYSVDSSVTIGN